jgi:dGTPase
MKGMIDELKVFLYDKFYKSNDVRSYNERGRKIITFLFEKFYNEPELMPEEFTKRLKKEEKHIVVKDYVSGMTDGFAIALYNKFNG